MMIMEETAFAKVNLALHVRGRRADGYHDIETIFAFADDGDRLTGEAADELSLSISGEFADGLNAGEDNLVIQTASLMQKHFAVAAGAKLHLIKNLPVAAGIGGGSADAAAAARLLVRLWGIKADESALAELLAPLGADIPACIASKTVMGQGTGTELRAIDDSSITGTPVLLVNPRQPVPTGPVFAAWNGADRGGLDDCDVKTARNDLQAPAIAICPAIADVLALLQETNPVLARMSGSGATCFALFDSVEGRDTAQSHIINAQPNWWTMTGILR